MTHFAPSAPFSVGIEEELLLVDEETLELDPVAAEVLTAMRASPTAAGHEAYAAEIELRSPPSASALQASGALADLRADATAAGATLMGAGVHPNGKHGEAPLVEADRYLRVDETMRGIIRRTPECALHVHVGMPDADTAVQALNGLRRHLPLLQGLSANSPWWFGADSGLASSRAALVRAYPGRGIPRAFHDFADWEQTVQSSIAAGDLADYTFLWWDVRLHPRHGTVEVREMDAQSSLEHVAALAALVRALAWEGAQAPPAVNDPSEALAWSAFRASRDGVFATILEDGSLRPLGDVAQATVRRLRPIARELGDEEALDAVGHIVAAGGGAARQRAAFARGQLPGMLRTLVDETSAARGSKPTA